MNKYFTFIENSVEEDYFPLHLSAKKLLRQNIDPTNHPQLLHYINDQAINNAAKFGVGGYLEKRNLYQKSNLFNQDEVRNIHLGIDVWAPANTLIASPLSGIVFASHFNEGEGNYGGTIILKHSISSQVFYSLFGHLSKNSITQNPIGRIVEHNKSFCSLGSPSENGGYLPHLHYQIMHTMLDYENDFPGVCSESQVSYFSKICPNPVRFLSNLIG